MTNLTSCFPMLFEIEHASTVSADSCMFERKQTHSNKSQNVEDVFIFLRVGCSNFSPQFVKTVTTEKHGLLAQEAELNLEWPKVQST